MVLAKFTMVIKMYLTDKNKCAISQQQTYHNIGNFCQMLGLYRWEHFKAKCSPIKQFLILNNHKLLK